MNVSEDKNGKTVQISQHTKSLSEKIMNNLFADDVNNNMLKQTRGSSPRKKPSRISSNDLCGNKRIKDLRDRSAKPSKALGTVYNLKNHVTKTVKSQKVPKQFECSFCNKKFSRSDIFKNHIQRVHYGRTFQCHLCDKAYRYKSNLTSHIKTHLEKKLYMCKTCKAKYHRKDNFLRHLKLHNVHACDQCDGQFTSKHKLVSHQRVHLLPKMKPQCKVCRKLFNKKYNFKRHWFTIHCKQSACFTEDKWMEMYDCVSITTEEHFSGTNNKSKKKGLSQKKLYTCNVCDKVFSQESNFKQHILSGHLEDGNASVNKKTIFKSKKKQHTFTVSQKNVNDQACDLKQHVNCSHCQKDDAFVDDEFGSETTYNESEKEKMCAKKRPKLRCKICKKTFTNSFNFKKHLRNVHSSNSDAPEFRKWENMCEFVEFKVKRNSTSEQLNPNTVTKVVCKICQQVLTGRLQNIKRHWFYKHSKEGVPNDDKWKELFEVVKVETIKSDLTGKTSDVIVIPKVFKCKSCLKMFGRACMFKRHWSSVHAQKSGPLQTWEETYELVEVEKLQFAADKSDADKTEQRNFNGVNDIKCKICKEIVCGRFQQFKQHWFAKHSDRKVPSNYSRWRKMYELIDVGAKLPRNVLNPRDESQNSIKKVNTTSRHQCKSCKNMTCVCSVLRSQKNDLPDDKEKTDKLKVLGNLPNEPEGEQQDKKFHNNASCTKVKVKCKFCHRMFSRGYNFRRHWLSFHFEEDVSSEDIQWEKFQEKVEVEEESNCKRKKTKRKVCQKTLSGCDPNFRQHYLSYHPREFNRSKDDRWKDLHEHVETNIKQISTKRSVKQCYRCKECRKVFSTGFNFKRHWLRTHSTENSDENNQWKIMYDRCFEGDVNPIDRPKKRDCNKKRKCNEKRNCDKNKRFQCNVCLKWLTTRFNLKRHNLSAHPEATVSPAEESNVEIKCECEDEDYGVTENACSENQMPYFAGKFDNTCLSEIKKECESVEDGCNSLCKTINGAMYVSEEKRSSKGGISQLKDKNDDIYVCQMNENYQYVGARENVPSDEFKAIEEMTYICPQCGEEANSATDLIQHDIDYHSYGIQ